jgi:hypothetical protein
LLHPGSRIRIPDPGGKKAPDPGSGSATLVMRKIRWNVIYRNKPEKDQGKVVNKTSCEKYIEQCAK